MTTLEAPLRSAALLPPPATSPVALLVDPSMAVCTSVLGLLEPQGYEVRVARDLADELDDAALVLVEADRGARAIGLIKQIRASRPELPIACVLGWWDDDEGEAARICRFVLHVPVREDQLQGLSGFAAAILAEARLH
jgi:hypothetical protein